MPHAAIKLYAGRSEADKRRLAEAVTLAIMNTLGGCEESVSVSITDVTPADCMSSVYQPEISAASARFYKRPGYGPAK